MTNRETLIAYLTMKVAEEDWHGVADAAMDLRELDAEARGRGVAWKTPPTEKQWTDAERRLQAAKDACGLGPLPNRLT